MSVHMLVAYNYGRRNGNLQLFILKKLTLLYGRWHLSKETVGQPESERWRLDIRHLWGEGKEKEDWRWEPWGTCWLLDVGERLWRHHRWCLGGCEAANWIEETVKGATVLHLLGNDSILLFANCIFAFCHIFYTCTLLPTLYFWKKLFAIKIIDFFS